jgi:hypothetical protein
MEPNGKETGTGVVVEVPEDQEETKLNDKMDVSDSCSLSDEDK